MPAVTRKTADLKDKILSNIDQKFNELKLEFLSELKDHIKKEVSEDIKTEIKKREELESTVPLLQEHVKNFQKHVSILKRKNEELDQYGRRCYLRIEGVPSVENESSDDVLGKVKSLITESGCEIPDVVIDRAHRIGRGYKDKTRNVPCKSITVRFLTFRNRTLFYRNSRKLKNAKVWLDLTKKRYKIFTNAIDFLKAYKNVDYVMVDNNCRLKVSLKNGRSSFFDNISDLKNLIVKENNVMIF